MGRPTVRPSRRRTTMVMDLQNNIKQLYLKDTSFANLMQKRIFNVLLVASYYDAFILEEDGRVEEQIFFEYTSLNLSSPPRVTQVNNLEDAFKELSTKRFDLIIAIPDAEHSQTYEKAKEIKHHYPDIPIVLLTPFAREVSRRLEKRTSAASTTCSAGWEIPTCCWLSSSCLKTR